MVVSAARAGTFRLPVWDRAAVGCSLNTIYMSFMRSWEDHRRLEEQPKTMCSAEKHNDGDETKDMAGDLLGHLKN
jgi:hypothetical protein